jgi:hypothetical protein
MGDLVYRRDGTSTEQRSSSLATMVAFSLPFCHGRLADIDAKLEELAVNPWHSPGRLRQRSSRE